MPLILAIETSTRLCSVAIGRDGALMAERNVESERMQHAESINVFIDEVLREAGAEMRELDAVAVGIGPGSYTGLRIGLSAAKGLCHALGIPIVGIGTLDVLYEASGVKESRSNPMIDARRMEVFTAPYDAKGHAMAEVEAVVLDDAWAEISGSITVFGDGADKAAELWPRHPAVQHISGVRPWARAMLRMAEARLQDAQVDDLAYLVPAYGKEARVTQPSKRKGLGL